MLVSAIKSKFLVYSDTMSTNWTNTQLNRIFEKAQQAYWNSLANNWGASLENAIDIAPIYKTINITPTSNIILYTSFPNYERIGFIKPTYVVGGETYSFPSKPIAENNKYSPLSSGTVRYPRHYLTDTGIVLEPSNTPTSLFCTYLREFYTIDFASPTTDIPYSEDNVQAIIQIALQNVAVSQRDFDEAAAVVNQQQFNKQ
jgi:hypothetical protein